MRQYNNNNPTHVQTKLLHFTWYCADNITECSC